MLWIILALYRLVNGFLQIFSKFFSVFRHGIFRLAHAFLNNYFIILQIHSRTRAKKFSDKKNSNFSFGLLTAVLSYDRMHVMSKGVHS